MPTKTWRCAVSRGDVTRDQVAVVPGCGIVLRKHRHALVDAMPGLSRMSPAPTLQDEAANADLDDIDDEF